MDQFEPIKTNTFVLLIDPILDSLFYGYSPLHCCKRFKNQAKTLEIVKGKLEEELDVIKMLNKIRDSYDIIKNLVNKDTR